MAYGRFDLGVVHMIDRIADMLSEYRLPWARDIMNRIVQNNTK